jgi:hypothetical protein
LRVLLEARALSDIGRHDLALEVVNNIDRPEAIRLRADILWAAKRFAEAAEQIELLHGDRWKDFEPLSEPERADILRAAIGYALGGDEIGIGRLKERYTAKMAVGPDRHAFDVATAPLGAKAGEFRQLSKLVAFDTLANFLRVMRARYPETGALSALDPMPAHSRHSRRAADAQPTGSLAPATQHTASR